MTGTRTTWQAPGTVPSRGWFTAALRRALRDGRVEVADCQALSAGVYRLALTAGQPDAVVVKRLDPGAAHRCRLLTHEWLPAAGLAQACPPMLAILGDGQRAWTVHAWLPGRPLDACLDRERVRELADLAAAVHIRLAGYPLISHLRHHCRYLGGDVLAGQLEDARQALHAIGQELPAPVPTGLARVVADLGERVHGGLRQAPELRALLREVGGPDTLLHADLWPKNAVAGTGWLRLVDWDRMGVGPALYDLSTLLFRLPTGYRRPALERYLGHLSGAGWPRPTGGEVAGLSRAIERARLASLISWRAQDLRPAPGEGARWAGEQLRLIGQWWDEVDAIDLECPQEVPAG